MEKTGKRIFYLDFIRALAVIMILLTHYNALYIYMEPQHLEKTILTVYPFGIYIGNVAVALFFIISGAALMHVYGDKFNIVEFYKKRILSIYPMWWIACIFAYSYWLLKYKTANPWGAEHWKILLTIIGFDQYFASLTVTFGIIGEWFLGCIILIYILFPIVRYLFNYHIKICILGVLGLYFYFIFANPWPLWLSVNVFVRLPEFLFGMYFYKYWKNVTWRGALIGTIVLITTTLWNPNIDDNIKTTYIGIAFFIVLVYVARIFEHNKAILYISSKICKYSYAIFISHHILMYEIGKQFDLANIAYGNSVALFAVCCGLSFITAFLLYSCYKFTIKQIAQMK